MVYFLGVLGFYFSQDLYSIRIPSDLLVGSPVTKVYVMKDLNSQEDVTCTIFSSFYGDSADNVSPTSYFAFHQQNHSIYLTHQVSGKYQTYCNGITVTLRETQCTSFCN